jgi:hypothetical protein
MESGPGGDSPHEPLNAPTETPADQVSVTSSVPTASQLTFVSQQYPPQEGPIFHPVVSEPEGDEKLQEREGGGKEDAKEDDEDDEDSVEREYACQFQETASIHGILQFLRFELLLEDIPMVKIEVCLFQSMCACEPLDGKCESHICVCLFLLVGTSFSLSFPPPFIFFPP